MNSKNNKSLNQEIRMNSFISLKNELGALY